MLKFIQRSSGDSKTILILEKHSFLRKMLFEIISDLDEVWMVMQITESADLERAALKSSPDVIITDFQEIKMLKNAFKKIKKLFPDTTIILYCDEVSQLYKKAAAQASADHVISKDTVVSDIKNLLSDIFWETEKIKIIEKEKDIVKSPGLLVADDDAFYRGRIDKALKKTDVRYKIVSSAEEAVKEFISGPELYGCIALDIHMNGINGVEAARIIKEYQKDVSIVLMTADESSETEERAREAGIERYLLKPFSDKKFLDTVMCAMRKEASKDASGKRHYIKPNVEKEK